MWHYIEVAVYQVKGISCTSVTVKYEAIYVV